jgi:hypothetical protein
MSGVSRVRWAAIGAAIAVSLGAGGIGIVNATISSGSKAVYVPIAPCRLADTRPGPENVGTRATPIGQRDTHTFAVHGNNGKCSIPAGASAVVANVTAVAPSAQSFMTIWPADRPQPTASSLNYSAGQAPFPNAVTVALSGDGKIKVYNHNGAVHVIIDIAGYYQDHTHDDRYYTKGQTDQKIAAIPAGVSAWDTIPSGVTVTGEETWVFMSTGTGGVFIFSVPLPAKAPVALTDSTVNFAESSGTSPTIGDGDDLCTGSTSVPTAPPGKVCLYRSTSLRATNLRGFSNFNLKDQGFVVSWDGSATGANQNMLVSVSWAYTAP